MYVKPPTMKEINKIKKPWRGVSLFAGAGGSSTGHKMAGINILVANEFVDHARECYQLNHPECMVIPSDIRRVDPKKILNYMGLRPGELDLLDGSPPCFTAGTKILTERGWLPIESLEVGTRVLTHKLRWKAITAVNKRDYAGTCFNLVAQGDWRFMWGDDNYCQITEKHPIYVRKDINSEPEWRRVIELEVNELIAVPLTYGDWQVPAYHLKAYKAVAYNIGLSAATSGMTDVESLMWLCKSRTLALKFLEGVHAALSRKAFDVCKDYSPILHVHGPLNQQMLTQIIVTATHRVPIIRHGVCLDLIDPVMTDEKFLWIRLTTRAREYKLTTVYNIAVDEDESYVAQNIVVHNCKAFSTAGRIEKNWGKAVKYSGSITQPVEDLFGHYCRMLDAFQPKVFTAENVSGLIRGASKGYFLETMQDFRDIGYNIRAVVMNAAWLGVPQSRERIIFMGVRKDLDIMVPDVAPLPEICTLAEALPYIARYKGITAGYNMYKSARNNPMRCITASDVDAHETARMSAAGFIETEDGERRRLTIEELRILSGLPPDYQLLGPYEKTWERLGRICVPQMTYTVSKELVEHVLIPYAKKRKKKPGDIFR